MPLRVLVVEDDPDDADLLVHELRRAGFEPAARCIDTEEAFLGCLEDGLDVILADYTLPGFGAPRALELIKQRRIDVPLIVVTGTVVEDVAVECMRRGAADYLLKDRLARLGPAVRQALAARQARSERQRYEQTLRESEERYALAARGANDGLWDWDLASNTFYVSERWLAMLGDDVPASSVGPGAWFDRIHIDDLSRFHAHLDAYLNGDLEHLHVEVRMLHADGHYRWMLLRGAASKNQSGAPQRLAGSLTDITDRKRAEEALIHDALHDALTGLPNRALFLDRVALALRRSRRRDGVSVGVVALGVDRFAPVNDSFGHAAGDELLIAIARRLEGCIRASDTVARLGADEFGILLDEVAHAGDAELVAERIRASLQPPVELRGHPIFVTMSTGIASAAGGDSRADELVRNAETAMHRAKGLGRDRHAVFDTTMHGQTVAMLKLEADLRRAIDRHELEVYYQPIVDATDGAPIALEALVRWRHPARGMVPPGDFIPFAEESGLIVPIGDWVLGRAIDELRGWDAAGLPPVRLSVNLSPRQLSQPDLVDRVAHALRRGNLPYNRLELELTESTIMENVGAAVAVLGQLRRIGVTLAVDDFGTGYSSLAYLQDLPIASLKVDRSFVRRVGQKLGTARIVKLIVNIAHDLGLRAIAEGIETPEQKRVLTALGCDELQGFLFGRPLPMREVVAMFSERAERDATTATVTAPGMCGPAFPRAG